MAATIINDTGVIRVAGGLPVCCFTVVLSDGTQTWTKYFGGRIHFVHARQRTYAPILDVGKIDWWTTPGKISATEHTANCTIDVHVTLEAGA